MMKTKIMLFAMTFGQVAFAAGITVQGVHGDVSVRHGVTEEWTVVATGDVLRPNDSMKTGPKGSAILLVRADAAGSAKKITLPPEVIMDMSDIRELSKDELMLKLTMEKVRSSSYEWKTNDLKVPNAAVVHGGDRSTSEKLEENHVGTGVMQLNGARVLFDNGFYSTCILRAMEVFRYYPSLAVRFDERMMLADALRMADLRGEALAEYGSITKLEGLTAQQRTQLDARMVAIRR